MSPRASRRNGRRSRLARALVLPVMGIALLAGSSAAHASPVTVSGEGTLYGGNQIFSFAATGNATSATGTMQFAFVPRGETTTAAVTCIVVVGKLANIVGVITSTNVPDWIPGTDKLMFTVEDVGTPGAGLDRFVVNPKPADPFARCELDPFSPGSVIDTGEIVVGGVTIPINGEPAFCNGQPIEPTGSTYLMATGCDLNLQITWPDGLVTAHPQ